jgi:hypothetical protein
MSYTFQEIDSPLPAERQYSRVYDITKAGIIVDITDNDGFIYEGTAYEHL